MDIEAIKAAVDAARERNSFRANKRHLPCPFCEFDGYYEIPYQNSKGQNQCARCSAVEGTTRNWNYRPAQQQSDAALLSLWDEHCALQWTTAADVAAMPAIVGRRVQIQAVIVEADQRDGLLEVELDSGRWLVIGSTELAVIE